MRTCNVTVYLLCLLLGRSLIKKTLTDFIGFFTGEQLGVLVYDLTTISINDSRFMFDEPSSYLDVKQRLKAAIAIRELLTDDKFVIVVEHDLAVLDYLSDFVCCLYGRPGAYGVVTMPFSVREG